ncbi:hypothetical protein C8T65DRAFT_707076 [Cerioporus squamosus]|nr:hypothetical protein C8T65DRAFT_707076 [Cerioporus squamosus]
MTACLPLIWIRSVPDANKDHERALVKYSQAMKTYEPIKKKYEDEVAALEATMDAADDKARPKLEKKLKALRAKPPPAPPKPQPRMRKEEIALMLSLSAALKLLLSSSTTRAQRDRGAELLYEYLINYKALYGLDAMMPNHHYASHIPEQLDLFATVYEMWAFLGERLNLVLKSTNLNGRRGGQQEITMMREFDRDQELRNMAQSITQTPSDKSAAGDAAVSIAQRILHNPHEARGTLEISAQDNGGWSHVQEDACCSGQIGLGQVSKHPVQLSLPNREEVLKFYRKHAPQFTIYHAHDPAAPRPCTYLTPTAHTLSYAVLLNGRRITPLSSSAIVRIFIEGHGYLVADIIELYLHKQSGQDTPQVFAEVRWMIPQDINRVFDNPWAA